MIKLEKVFKYRCIKFTSHWGGKKWEVGDIISSAEWVTHEHKDFFEPIELSIKERFDDFRKGMKLSYSDIASITGNTKASIKSVINSGRIPAWAKLSIWMYETGQYQNPIWQKMKDSIVRDAIL